MHLGSHHQEGLSSCPKGVEPMLSENIRNNVVQRIQNLLRELSVEQFKTQSEIPHQLNRLTVGEYTSLLDFSTTDSPDPRKAIVKDVQEANGSTFMGLWFISGSVPLLQEAIAEADSIVDGDEGSDKDAAVLHFQQSLEQSVQAIIDQLTVAKGVPKFFQGGTQAGTLSDIHKCPQYTMGWYPLVDKTRIPAVIPDVIQNLLDFLERLTKKELDEGMANLSDGDIWSWCIGIEHTTPGILDYFGLDTLKQPDIYEQLLGTYLRETFGDEGSQNRDSMSQWLNDISIDLWTDVRKANPDIQYPVETFYNPNEGPKGAFSCAVMANILSAIPLLDEVPHKYIKDIEHGVHFVRTAARMALSGEIRWQEYAYDYYTIPSAPVGYLSRANRIIHERKAAGHHPHYPDLLDERLLEQVADWTFYTAAGILGKEDENILAGNEASEEAVKGNLDYATLVYCFLTMMNIWAVNPALYRRVFYSPGTHPDTSLVDRTAQLLLNTNEAANLTPGTGPYKLFDVGPIDIYVSMSSICFIVPPMVEAYTLYLLSEKAPS